MHRSPPDGKVHPTSRGIYFTGYQLTGYQHCTDQGSANPGGNAAAIVVESCATRARRPGVG